MIKSLKTQTRSNVMATGKFPVPKSMPITQSYASQSELKEHLQNLDKMGNETPRTIILLLSEDFDGHLPSFIRRKNPGQQIIITSGLGYLPGLVSRNDISFRAGMLGWSRISIVHDLDDVISEINGLIHRGEQVIILKPEGTQFPFE